MAGPSKSTKSSGKSQATAEPRTTRSSTKRAREQTEPEPAEEKAKTKQPRSSTKSKTIETEDADEPQATTSDASKVSEQSRSSERVSTRASIKRARQPESIEEQPEVKKPLSGRKVKIEDLEGSQATTSNASKVPEQSQSSEKRSTRSAGKRAREPESTEEQPKTKKTSSGRKVKTEDLEGPQATTSNASKDSQPSHASEKREKIPAKSRRKQAATSTTMPPLKGKAQLSKATISDSDASSQDSLASEKASPGPSSLKPEPVENAPVTPSPPPTPVRKNAPISIYASDSPLSDLGATPSPPTGRNISPVFRRLIKTDQLCHCSGWCTCARYKIFYSGKWAGNLTAKEIEARGHQLPSQTFLPSKVLVKEEDAESCVRESWKLVPEDEGGPEEGSEWPVLDESQIKQEWSWDEGDVPKPAPNGWSVGAWPPEKAAAEKAGYAKEVVEAAALDMAAERDSQLGSVDGLDGGVQSIERD